MLEWYFFNLSVEYFNKQPAGGIILSIVKGIYIWEEQ